ncbi:glycerate kinase [Salinicoccus sp. ID82-1]|uniref:glycerate kinase n=1 Tax=Salinicoccus sp. ID82-1 TaxID=2820269 RepID=UPI001F45C8D3|nr:glycerate kinase [Salinicoccus sp. ID82-1]MCG1009863.1 glycerate kinase [Salinicoccus sp. ID82-1]
MKIVIAPDSYKGTLDQYEVARVMQDALEKSGHTGIVKPMSDGGDGLLKSFSNEGYAQITVNITGPEGDTVEAVYYFKDGTAVIETAEACGLHLITDSHPGDRTTFGVGEMIMHAMDQGAAHIILGLGGSATNDGGYGMFMALGGRATGADGLPSGIFNRDIPKISSFDTESLRTLDRITLTIASDVNNPLLGQSGAVSVFGPQKGIAPEEVEMFETMLQHLSQKMKEPFPESDPDAPGSGAAGGLGWMLMTLGAEMKPGGDLVAEKIQLETAIMEADAVITGDGRSDSQTLHGKVPAVVAKLARKHRKPCYLISGQLTADLGDYFTGTHALAETADDIQKVMEDTPFHLEKKINEIFST